MRELRRKHRFRPRFMSHACIYCVARPTHAHLGLDSGRDFEREIVVKVKRTGAAAGGACAGIRTGVLIAAMLSGHPGEGGWPSGFRRGASADQLRSSQDDQEEPEPIQPALF